MRALTSRSVEQQLEWTADHGARVLRSALERSANDISDVCHFHAKTKAANDKVVACGVWPASEDYCTSFWPCALAIELDRISLCLDSVRGPSTVLTAPATYGSCFTLFCKRSSCEICHWLK